MESIMRTSSPTRRLVSVLTSGLLAAGLLVTTTPAAQAEEGAQISVGRLQANARSTPMGIGTSDPVLGWQSSSTGRGVVQSAYAIRVGTTEGGGDAWSTGKVESSEQADVRYAGDELASQTRYYWQVKVWDSEGHESEWSAPSWFETGIADADEWKGDWVGEAGQAIDSWKDYTTELDFTLDNLAFGVYLRAKDTNNGYMWQISTSDGTTVPKLRPHKKVGGGYSVLDSVPITTLTAQQLRTGKHKLTFKVDGDQITTLLDGEQIDQRRDSTFTQGFVGFRTDQAANEQGTVHRVTVTSATGDRLLDTDFSDGANPFGAGTIKDGALKIGGGTDTLHVPVLPKPLLRREFAAQTGKTIERARLYASARGVYEVQLNGEKVGDEHLAPGDTDYNIRIQSQTYDVTDQVNNGANGIGVTLGDGWYAGHNANLTPGFYGTDLAFLGQLRIDYTDGSSQIVKTDDTWTTHTGPYVAADNLKGESYDARREQPGYDQPGFDDSGWSPAAVLASTTSKIVPQLDQPVRTVAELPAKSRSHSGGDTYVYDLGQNMVGVARVRIQGVAGQTVTLRHGEVVNPDGTLYTANLKTATATDHYTFKTTGTVVYEPSFTFHGFRYVEVSGATTAPGLDDVTGQVFASDLPATGTFTSSNSMLNQLQSNITWGQRGNFLSIPTDTPARDERLGWSGDINVFAPTASYLSDTRPFLRKWMQDLRDTQRADGSTPGAAPTFPTQGVGSGTGWEDAMITVPYAVWTARGDKDILRENYPAMKKFFSYVRKAADGKLVTASREQYGDWLNLNDGTSQSVLSTAYYAEDARMLSEIAAALGEDGDAAELAELSDDIRRAFADQLVAADGTVSSNSQTAYAMALGLNLVTDPAQREKVGEKFVAKLKSKGNHLSTGFLGTPLLLPALSSIGRDDLAYTVLLNEDFPSWGYQIAKGATTMWERWDAILPDGSFNDPNMTSFNHYAYGAVGNWMYQNIAGISPLEPGYKTSRIAPVVGGGLTSGHGELDSVYGTISSTWKAEGDDLSVDIQVPVNTTSRVSIPAGNLLAVTEGSSLLTDADGISDVSFKDGVATFTAGSGSYRFAVSAERARLGDILAEIEKTDRHASDLQADGDLAAADRAQVGDRLAAAADRVKAASAADGAGDRQKVAQQLAAGLQQIRELKATLAQSSSVDGPVKGDLNDRLEAIESLFAKGVAASLGVTVVIPPVAAAGRPGRTVSGTVEVANNGGTRIAGLRAEVAVRGWKQQPDAVTHPSLDAGEDVQLPFTVTVPKRQKPGAYDASVSLTFDTAYGTFVLTDTTPWISIDSGVEITDVTSQSPADGSEERVAVRATVRNNGDVPVSGQVAVTLPEGWTPPPTSDIVTIPAGASREVTVPVNVGLGVVGGDVPLTVAMVDQGVTLASADSKLNIALPAPPTQEILDYVDFGDAPSETDHAVQAHERSGRNSEAGLTRRYADRNYPGSYYSAEYRVTPGQPFLLRNRETFDGAKTKKYNIYVDDTLVTTYELPRAEEGIGTKTYQVLVDDPAVLANDGTVRIKYEFPA
ncbi:family 78 glycoside hydrolase catalytic domain, partial [Aeromicrobium chenweiae]